MKSDSNILEIPIDKTKNVNDLARWLEQKKVHKKDHPSLSLSVSQEFPQMVVLSIVILVGMALIILEEKGKLKVNRSLSEGSSDDFLHLITKSQTERKIEKLIESRYNLDLVLHAPHHGSYVSEPQQSYNLNDVFGIWKNQKMNLDNIREQQWGKRK